MASNGNLKKVSLSTNPDEAALASLELGNVVYLNGVVTELESKGFEAAFDQPQGVGVVRQVDPVEQRSAIAGVGIYRLRPPFATEPHPTLISSGHRGGMLIVGGGGPG